MYLLVQPHGARLWRLKYRHGGRERVYAIGVYDEISLAAARAERERARAWLRDGKDPTIERRIAKATAGAQQVPTFGLIAEEWLSKQRYSKGHAVAPVQR